MNKNTDKRISGKKIENNKKNLNMWFPSSDIEGMEEKALTILLEFFKM